MYTKHVFLKCYYVKVAYWLCQHGLHTYIVLLIKINLQLSRDFKRRLTRMNHG